MYTNIFSSSYRMDPTVMEKSVLITGCSSGIGLCTCEYLKSKGYRVFATARKAADVERLRQQGFEAFQLDVNSMDQIKEVVTKITQSTEGTLYALVNNAGSALPGALEDISIEDLKNQFETNVFALQAMTNAVLPIMRAQGYGRIVNISSVLGLISLPFRGAYNASKYAVEGLSDTLRLELRHTPIFVSLVEPGPIESNFRKNAIAASQSKLNIEASPFRESYKKYFDRYKDTGYHPSKVAKKIEKALASSRPKAHYYVTPHTYLFGTLKRLLPQRALDFLLAKIADQEIN